MCVHICVGALACVLGKSEEDISLFDARVTGLLTHMLLIPMCIPSMFIHVLGSEF